MWVLGIIWLLVCLIPSANQYGLGHVLDALQPYENVQSPTQFLDTLLLFFIPAEIVTYFVAQTIFKKTGKKKLGVPGVIFLLMALAAIFISYLSSNPLGYKMPKMIGVNYYMVAASGANFFMLWTALNAVVNILYIAFSPARQPAQNSTQLPIPKETGQALPIAMPVIPPPQWQLGQLKNLTPTEFEELTAELFKKLGFHAQVTRASGDGGVDVYAFKNGQTVVISCKKYKDLVEPTHVRDLHSVTITSGARAGVLMSTGRFSDATRNTAAQMKPPIYLISGTEMIDLLNGVTTYPQLS